MPDDDRRNYHDGSLIIFTEKEDVALVRLVLPTVQLAPRDRLFLISHDDHPVTAFALLARAPGGYQRVDLARGRWVIAYVDDVTADPVGLAATHHHGGIE